MRKMLSDAKFVSVLFLFLAGFYAFPQSIINPSGGEWANRQILYLDLPDGTNAFYSVSGNDPESSGFAYDGPVLLDLEGEVLLKVAFVSSDGKKRTEIVSYTVAESALPEDSVSAAFIENACMNGLLDYTAGDVLSIPSALEYSFGNDGESFEEGKEISVPHDTVIHRALPCSVTDGLSKWRFVVRVNPVMSGVFSRIDVPFSVSGWEKITFTDRNLIYKIDDGWWEQPKLPLTLDRTKSHMISWQSVDYSSENPVRFFVLPPKPEIKTEIDKSGAKYVYASGEPGYKFALAGENGEFSELYDSLRFDTFRGDEFSGSAKTGIFYDSVYQGEMNINFRVNRRLPKKPEIISSAENGWARKLVTLNIKKPSGTDLYVALQGPVVVEEGSGQTELLFSFMEKDFRPAKSGRFVLQPSNDGAVAYKVSAYALDSNGNRSNVSEYSVVIDSFNYYVDAEVSRSLKIPCDGSKERPFASFSELLTYIDESRFARVYLTGEMEMPAKKYVLSSNMEIIGGKDARIVFPENASFSVRNASLAVSDCIVSYSKGDDSSGNQRENPRNLNHTLFSLERGVLVLDSSEVLCAFGKNGNVINAENSVVTVKNSRITGSSDAYASCITSVDSKVSVKDSRVTLVSGTGVLFSCQGGIFELRKTSCSVVASMGRIAELFNTHSSVTDNEFFADLKKNQENVSAVYMDSKNLSVEESGNTSRGF